MMEVSYLKTLIEADEDGGSGCTVALSTNKPVGKTLPERIITSVEDVKEDGSSRHASMSIVEGLLLALGKEAVLPLLELVTTSPNNHTGHKDDSPSKSGTVGTLQPRQVKNEANKETTQHLGKPIECAIERSGTDVEGESVDIVLLIAVKHVGREEERYHTGDLPLHDGTDSEVDGTLESVVLSFDGLVQLSKSDALGGADKDAEKPAKEHNGHQCNVSRVADGSSVGVVVETERHQRANATTEVEDDPEDGNGSSLLRLFNIGRHNSALDNPNERSADTENCARGNDEGAVVVNVGVEQTAAVEGICPATNEEANARTNP